MDFATIDFWALVQNMGWFSRWLDQNFFFTKLVKNLINREMFNFLKLGRKKNEI